MNSKIKISKIACVGGGLIGASWATQFSMKGYAVNLYDLNDAQLEISAKYVNENYASLCEYGVLTEEQSEGAMKRIRYTKGLKEALEDVQLIQESGPERYEIKQSILAQIDEIVGDDVIYASSTSGLLISKIAEKSKYTKRCVCAHPYNPPHLVPLVELVGYEGADEAVEILKEFYSSIGKEPVVLHKEVPGFIANRIQAAVGREIIDLVLHGVCSVEDADKALTFGPGVRWAVMGQNLLYDLGGGPDGVKGMYQKIGGDPNRKTWLDDMARWTKYPPEWPEIAQEGVDNAIKKRPPKIGNTKESLTKYRDKMLIEILKLHKKL